MSSVGYDVDTITRTYRTLFDQVDREMAVGGPYLFLDRDRAQPAMSRVSLSVACTVALAHLNPGVNSALLFRRPTPP